MTTSSLNGKSLENQSYPAARKAVEDFFKIHATTKIALPSEDVKSFVDEYSAIALAYQVHRATVNAIAAGLDALQNHVSAEKPLQTDTSGYKSPQSVKNDYRSEIADSYTLAKIAADAVFRFENAQGCAGKSSAIDVCKLAVESLRPYLRTTAPEVDTIYHAPACYARNGCKCPRTYKALKPVSVKDVEAKINKSGWMYSLGSVKAVLDAAGVAYVE